jgi:hypothetical protein
LTIVIGKEIYSIEIPKENTVKKWNLRKS